MSFRVFLAILVSAALGLLLPSVTRGGGIPVYPERPEAEPGSGIVFETSFPVRELPEKKWNSAQQKDIDRILERMKRDDSIFVVVKTVSDPIGSREENERWALGISREVGERLLESGIRPDRILIVPGEENPQLFDARRWERFVPLQRVYLRVYRGGGWMRRRGDNAAGREGLLPEGRIQIRDPAAQASLPGKTIQDMSN